MDAGIAWRFVGVLVSKTWRLILVGSHTQDYSILGSMLGFLIYGKYPTV